MTKLIYSLTGLGLLIAASQAQSAESITESVMKTNLGLRRILSEQNQSSRLKEILTVTEQAKTVKNLLYKRIHQGYEMVAIPLIPTTPTVTLTSKTQMWPVDGGVIRSCSAVREAWKEIMVQYNKAILVLNEYNKQVNATPSCGPCIDTLEEQLDAQLDILEDIGQGLKDDGVRRISVAWTGEQFRNGIKDSGANLKSVSFDSLSYYLYADKSMIENGKEPLAFPPNFELDSSLVNGVSFQTEAPTEYICGEAFDIRFDGNGAGIGPHALVPVDLSKYLVEMKPFPRLPPLKERLLLGARSIQKVGALKLDTKLIEADSTKLRELYNLSPQLNRSPIHFSLRIERPE